MNTYEVTYSGQITQTIIITSFQFQCRYQPLIHSESKKKASKRKMSGNTSKSRLPVNKPVGVCQGVWERVGQGVFLSWQNSKGSVILRSSPPPNLRPSSEAHLPRCPGQSVWASKQWEEGKGVMAIITVFHEYSAKRRKGKERKTYKQ